MRRLTCLRFLAAIMLAVPLGACGDEPEAAQGDVSGEVLEGTISDDMLPLERLQSRAPLADPSPAASGSAVSQAAAEPASEAEAGQADAAPQAAASAE